MKQLFDKQKIINIILILYTLSIILDLHIFYNSISTLIRAVIISALFLVVFFKFSDKKDRKYLCWYFCIYGFYVILHLLNLNDNNLFAELLYFYKMLMHVLIIYTVYKLGINLKFFNKIINLCLLLISGSIVFCNIFKLGYTAYNLDPIGHSIFEWFNANSADYISYSGKGYFHLANQIVAIILLYLPVLINKTKEHFNVLNVFTMVITLISLLIISNRIASLGTLLVLIASILVYLFLVILKKEKIKISFLIINLSLTILFGLMLLISPLILRNEFYDNLLESSPVNKSEISTDVPDSEEVDTPNSVDEIFAGTLINRLFPTVYYPYETDPEFWDELIRLDNNLLYDSRFVELKIVKRLVELNDNQKLDSLFGIGYDKIINVQNIERDYIMQYYSIGIIGTIVIIGVYIVIYLYLLLKIFINLEEKFNYKNLMVLMGIGVVLLAAYFSGNLFNAISVIFPLSFMIGIVLCEINYKQIKEREMILGFNVTTLNEKQLCNNLEDDLKNHKQNIIFNINPLIVANFYKDEKMVNEFNKQSYNIPDGIGTVYASKMKGGNLKDRITGIDLMLHICKMASKNNFSIYLYGAKKGIAEKAAKELKKTYKKINVVGTMDGYVSHKQAIKDIAEKKPDILFVAMGSPIQEKFIIENKNKLKNSLLIMPVGGSFDVISKTIKRAPEIWSKFHLEWLYRMIKEPKRIKNNLNIVRFVFLVIFRNNWYNKKRSGDKL